MTPRFQPLHTVLCLFISDAIIKMAGWPQLPTELRWLIFDFIKADHSHEADPLARAYYAVVCQEWQFVFESENFATLTLNQDRLDNFKSFIDCNKRRRNLVRRLVLHIKLEDYDPTPCETAENECTIKR